jgi:hypothetical protein
LRSWKVTWLKLLVAIAMFREHDRLTRFLPRCLVYKGLLALSAERSSFRHRWNQGTYRGCKLNMGTCVEVFKPQAFIVSSRQRDFKALHTMLELSNFLQNFTLQVCFPYIPSIRFYCQLASNPT